MAIGAVTPVYLEPHSNTQQIPVTIGSVKMTVTNVVGAASYTTGGDPITPQQLGLTFVLAGQVEIFTTSGGTGTSASLIPTNGGSTLNLKNFTNANAEVASLSNQSTTTWQIIAFGY